MNKLNRNFSQNRHRPTGNLITMLCVVPWFQLSVLVTLTKIFWTRVPDYWVHLLF